MRRALAVVAVVTLAAARASAGGFERVEQSPEAVATAGAQTADAYAAAAIFYNPAAMAFQRGLTLQGGAVVTLARQSATVGAAETRSSTDAAAPAVYLQQRVAARFAVGIAVFTPFAASTHHPTPSPLRAPYQLELRTVAVNPSLAIRPLGWLSVGFGVDIVPTTLEMLEAQPDGALVSTRRRGTGVGGNAGLLVRALPGWLDVAVAYRSAMDVEVASSSSKTSLPLPHQFAFALASRPLRGLTATTDVRLTLWQDLAALRIVDPAGMPVNLITLNWQNSVGVRAGLAYAFWRDADDEPRATVRIGGGWDQAPTSTANTVAAFADGDRVLAGAGAGLRWRAVTLDAGYLVAIVQPFVGAAGGVTARYESITHIVAVALTIRLPELGYRVDEIAFKR